MSVLDYMPIIGPYRAFSGQSEEDDDSSCLGGECGSTTFMDQKTGQEIEGAYLECGECGYVPIREGDVTCGGCGRIRTAKDENCSTEIIRLERLQMTSNPG